MPESKTFLQDAVRNILKEDCLSAVLYDHYSKIAEDEDYTTIAATLRQMRNYKQTHARSWLEKLGLPENTCTALESALLLTNTDRERYQRYAAQVQDKALATRFRNMVQCEGEMEKVLLRQLAQLQLQQATTQFGEWHCCRCGYPWANETPPLVCPVCGGKHSFVGK